MKEYEIYESIVKELQRIVKEDFHQDAEISLSNIEGDYFLAIKWPPYTTVPAVEIAECGSPIQAFVLACIEYGRFREYHS